MKQLAYYCVNFSYSNPATLNHHMVPNSSPGEQLSHQPHSWADLPQAAGGGIPTQDQGLVNEIGPSVFLQAHSLSHTHLCKAPNLSSVEILLFTRDKAAVQHMPTGSWCLSLDQAKLVPAFDPLLSVLLHVSKWVKQLTLPGFAF